MEKNTLAPAKAGGHKVMKNPPALVFLDIAKQDFLKDPFVGRIVIELYPSIAPKTVANFKTLCLEKKYINTLFHRVIQGFMVQGGDIVNQDGTGVYSIYGGAGTTFDDENFAIRHSEPGIISMANMGPNTNSSQFFITTQPSPHLDGKHVGFGKVIRGMEFVYDIEKEVTDSHGRPIRRCYIMNSGTWSANGNGDGRAGTGAAASLHPPPLWRVATRGACDSPLLLLMP